MSISVFCFVLEYGGGVSQYGGSTIQMARAHLCKSLSLCVRLCVHKSKPDELYASVFVSV